MRRFRVRTFVIFALASLAGAALLHTSQSVQRAEERMQIMNAEIEKERDAIRVLNAEWEYLNRPERLEKLANEFLDLVPPGPDMVQDSMMLEAVSLPERQEVEKEQAELIPVSSLHSSSVQSTGGKMDHTDKPCDDENVECAQSVPKPRYKPSALKSRKPSKEFGDLLNEIATEEGEGAQ